ncbi:MAG: DUF106 domain-containing protein [Candidatus Bathyarchaeota archaeon]|nr:MAG: DUF106 domain-containing protein [Candidatus Bathyarchaeota archaeon]
MVINEKTNRLKEQIVSARRNKTMDIAVIPLATVVIMLIAIAVSFLNMAIQRLLITRMCGWKEYKVMQKETSEHRSKMMQAMRANDKKLMEKLKKKQSQIDNMQKKMMKPQMILLPISFSYLVIWYLFLIPVYGANAVAYVPGIAPPPSGIPVFIWYMLCSFFLGTLASRVIGTSPIA